MRLAWGETLDLTQVEHFISRLPRGGWVWMVHNETSTGVLNPFDEIKTLCARHGLHLCADCISSIGAMPVDLTGVRLATCASGKGLGSYPGLSMVFHDYHPQPQPDRLPGYLDLGWWIKNDSIPHTHSSNLLNALFVAVKLATPGRMERIRANMRKIRAELPQCGLRMLAPETAASPVIVTLVSDEPGLAAILGEELEMRGYWLSYRSAYLLEKNWMQISLLGDPSPQSVEKLLNIMRLASARLRPQKKS
jgi:aspartate aminotransferase-like enzyme